MIEKGWSDDNNNGTGNDARSNLSGSTQPFHRRLGYISTGCTGTMIEQSDNGAFMLTAAHCLYDKSGFPISGYFEPARGATTSPSSR